LKIRKYNKVPIFACVEKKQYSNKKRFFAFSFFLSWAKDGRTATPQRTLVLDSQLSETIDTSDLLVSTGGVAGYRALFGFFFVLIPDSVKPCRSVIFKTKKATLSLAVCQTKMT
jgi:hypothetical protein